MSDETVNKITITDDQFAQVNKNGLVELSGDLVLVKKELLENILTQNEEYKSDMAALRKAIMQFCTTLNLTTPDGNNIKPEIIKKEKSPIKFMIKSASNIFGLIMKSGISSEAERELNEKFAFLDDAAPILEKYGKQ